MKKLIAAILLLTLTTPVFAIDSASDAHKRTKDIERQAALDEVPRLTAEVEREINISVQNGVYFTVVRVNGYSENAVHVVATNLKIKGYEVEVGRSGKHNQYRSLVISWEK